MAATNKSFFSDVVIDTTGAALDGIRWRTFGPNVGALINAFTTTTLSQSTFQPVVNAGVPSTSPKSEDVTDATGLIEFWANPGLYRIDFHDTIGARVSDRSIYWYAGPGEIGQVAASFLSEATFTGDIAMTRGGGSPTPLVAALQPHTVHNAQLALTTYTINKTTPTTVAPADLWKQVLSLGNTTIMPAGFYVFIANCTVTTDGTASGNAFDYAKFIGVRMGLEVVAHSAAATTSAPDNILGSTTITHGPNTTTSRGHVSGVWATTLSGTQDIVMKVDVACTGGSSAIVTDEQLSTKILAIPISGF